MMKYALLESGREINALDISNGTLRSNNYNCICCGNTVTFVTGSYRSKPHFRHKNEESCINYSNYSIITQDADDRIENRKSKFHKDWQSFFTKDTTEVRIKEQNKLHIADIYLKNPTPFQFTTNILKTSVKNLVIEIQHSHISLSDAKQREQFYVIDNRALIWIIDISHIQHKIEQYTTFTQDKTRILFTGKQHGGLTNIIKGCQKSIVILDNGTYLFKVINAHLDSGFTEVFPISKSYFLQQLSIDTFINNQQSLTIEMRSYRDYISALDDEIKVDIDEILNMIEDIPITCLREGCQLYASKEYETYVEMIVSWMGIVSNRNPIVYKVMVIWLNNVRKTHYVHDKLEFGKYKNTSICNLPQHYLKWVLEEGKIKDKELEIKLLELRMMDTWFVNHCFKNASKLVYLKRCRDNYYRYNWDKRTNQDRLPILESVLKRPWIDMIDEVIPNEQGFVCTHNYFDLPYDSRDYEKQQGANSDDDNAYICKYKPTKVNTKYIAICEEDLLYWYGVLDEQFGYDYNKKCLRSQQLKRYAFVDI